MFTFTGVLDLAAPGATMTILDGLNERRDQGQYTFLLDMNNATIGRPDTCPSPELVTSIKVGDGTNPPFVLGFDHVWECVQRGKKAELVKVP